MRPADETPAPASGQRADKLNHIDSDLQGSQPPEPPAPPAAGERGRNVSANLSQLYLQYLSNPTQDRLDELLKQCLRFLEKRVSYWVNYRGFCPPWLHSSTFVPDAFDRACDKFWSKLHSLRSPHRFERWLKKVAFSAVVEELRDRKRRTKKWSCWFEPLDIEHPGGTVTHVLDRAENHDAALRYGCVTAEQIRSVKQLVYRDILGKLFDAAQNCSVQQRAGIEFLKMMLDYDVTADEIAAERGMKKSIVQSCLRAGRQKLREIAETKYRFKAEDL